MAQHKTITDVLLEGGGLRITWSTGEINQFTWELINGAVTLTEDGVSVDANLLSEIINKLPKQYNSSTFWEHLFGSSGGQGEGVTGINMSLVGALNSAGPLPVIKLGSELVGKALTLTTLRGRRDIAGSSGTTTIQLEINGAAINGAVLSWASTDNDLTLKTIMISQPIVPGDLVSFRLISREYGAENLFIEVD